MSDSELARLGQDDGDGSDAENDDVPVVPVALYVHVPFCLSKCGYCDFTSAVSDTRWHAPYVDAVLFAAAHWDSYDLLGDVPTLYFGGGTPTILGDELVRLVERLAETISLRPDAEITVETNPDTTDPTLVASLMAAGVNRFSLGVQSLDDAVLRTLGRRHSAQTALAAAQVLAESGMPFSVDLICGVPGQSEESWRATLVGAIATGAGHLSVYPLSIEAGTPLATAVEAGTMSEPDSDTAAAMMIIAEDALREAGFVRYEVANYARPGQESRHNTTYWTGGAYLGLGPAAASMLPVSKYAVVADAEGWGVADRDAARVRFSATCDTTDFIRRPLAAPAEVEFLSAEETAREDVMLGMRLSAGVPAEQVTKAGLDDVLAGLLADGLVERVTDGPARWSVTRRGWLLGNTVFGRIWDISD